ncbi:hypothetical protein AB0G04_11800 [Actinoplanes sp. NPDC023801]|uniref:hypothetical protein n=1 Tax=Actinoplanes sp. NPDC023801 TaxID=3154595 RepID=UPI0033E0016C
MERIEFRTDRQEIGDAGLRSVIVPYIGGMSLIDRVRKVEQRFAGSSPAGGYAGLFPSEVAWPRRHYLGEPALSWFGDGDTVLLGCVCGEWGCWPLTATVTVDDWTVTWSGFRHGHRENWDYREVRDFVFDRTAYEEALRATAE